MWSFIPWFTGHSSYRHKRDVSDDIQDTLARGLDAVRDEISGSIGTGEVCGAAGVKIPARCNEISECICEGLGACTCVSRSAIKSPYYPSFVLLIVVIISNFLNRYYWWCKNTIRKYFCFVFHCFISFYNDSSFTGKARTQAFYF